MAISYMPQKRLLSDLLNRKTDSLDFIILITGAINLNDDKYVTALIEETTRTLKSGGILFVQGYPVALPKIGVQLEKYVTFKYWLSIESSLIENTNLPTVHAAVLLYTKGNGRFNIKRVRLPHQQCIACERSLKDWGGKAHLMHPDGYVISDVIKDLPLANNYSQISRPLFDLLTRMLDFPQINKDQSEALVNSSKISYEGIVGPKEGLPWKYHTVSESAIQYSLPLFAQDIYEKDENKKSKSHVLNDDNLFNVIHQGDAIEILKKYPDESIDLVFADPPYNLEKNYSVYNDDQSSNDYINWCNNWLSEYIRILKPTGSLFVLNLPKWAIHHANFLNQHLYFQNWIVWDALSEPRGKVMPAHYAILFHTKSADLFTFNYDKVSPIDARHYCLRASCIKQRKLRGDNKQSILTDIWWDIHRIKHRRDRDYHPCQLPDLLMKRIITLFTNQGDVVLDAFAGTGTTPLTALQLGRRYVAIDLDPHYVDIMKQKINQFNHFGNLQRKSTQQQTHTVSKKELQLELRRLSLDLGRLPTQNDVKEKSKYDLDLFLETFPTWGKAIKAAKLEIQSQ